MLGRSRVLMLVYLIAVSLLAYYSYFSSHKGLIVSGQGYCSSTQCEDYQGNCIDSGGCGYPTEDYKNANHPSYCDNGEWVGTTCVCLTDQYPSCTSLGYKGSCGSCAGSFCVDPSGTKTGQAWCYGKKKCSSTQCEDYQGNCIDSGGCGYPTEDYKNANHPSYCDNGEWVGTTCVCLTDQYPSCTSLGYKGSCGSCADQSFCVDPNGTKTGQAWCYGKENNQCGGEGQSCCSGNTCNSGLKCCDDGKCHECCSDSDCSGYDPDTHTKMVCDLSTHTCKPKYSCDSNSDCDLDYCCDTITPTYKCKSKGTIINSGGKSYLCDPPYGLATTESEINQTTEEQKVETTSLIDVIFGILSNLFS